VAHADDFPRAALAGIADEIGDLITDCLPQLSGAKAGVRPASRRAGARAASSAPAPARAKPEVIDTFEVWTLDTRSLSARTTRTRARGAAGRRHGAAGLKHVSHGARSNATGVKGKAASLKGNAAGAKLVAAGAKGEAAGAKSEAACAKRGASGVKGGVASVEGPSLVGLARRTGRWHHQVKIDDRAVAFARSTEPEASGARLRGLFVSPLALKVDEAITWIDERERRASAGARASGGTRAAGVGRGAGADPLVRLLVVLSHQVHAFWLLEEASGSSGVLIIDAPPGFAPPGRRTLLGERAFFDLLLRHRPCRGLA
jgi:hypothetical protein